MTGNEILKKMGMQEYDIAYSSAINKMVVIVRDRSVKVQDHYRSFPIYTVDEVEKTAHLSEDAFRRVHLVKTIFKGEIIK